jgi:hypothetical protein
MVSLSKLCRITEEGVEFQSPYDGTMSLLTPERSIAIQHAIGQIGHRLSVGGLGHDTRTGLKWYSLKGLC